MFNTEKFEALVNKTQESSLAASLETSPFVSAAKKAGASARSALTKVKSKLNFSDLDSDTFIPNSQSRSSRSKNQLLDDPDWKNASTPAEKTTIAVNWLIGFFGPIIEQLNNFGDVIKSFGERLDKVEKKTPVNAWGESTELSDLRALVSDLKDELDEVRQRSMKGNLIVTSKERTGRNGRKIPSLAKKKDQESDLKLVLRLIKEKTDVDVPVEDVQACHVLGRFDSGSYIVRFNNRRSGSAWDSVNNMMMTGKDMSNANIFINFQLTKHRSDLSYQVRAAKRDRKIFSYSVDQNGRVSVRKIQNGEKTVIRRSLDLTNLIDGN